MTVLYNDVVNELKDRSLSHFGVKGMKWGVRRDLQKLRTSKEREAYLNEKDKKWVDKVNNNPKVSAVSRRVSRRMKREVYSELDKEYSWTDLTISKKKRLQYDLKAKNAMEEILEQEIYRAHKYSPTRTKEVTFEPQRDGTYKAVIVERRSVNLQKDAQKIARSDARRDRREAREAERAAREREKAKAAKHAEEEQEDLDDLYEGMVFLISTNNKGHFVETFSVVDESLGVDIHHMDDIDTVDPVDNFLAHYGVKGMRWGVRRSRQERAAARPSSPKKKVDGKPTPSNPKAKGAPPRSGTIASPKKRVGPTPSSPKKRISDMSDDELRSAINRINMERQYAKMMAESRPRSAGEKFLKGPAKELAITIGRDIAKDAAVKAGRYMLTEAVSRKNPALGEALRGQPKKKK